jgi:hypothetical protein
MILTLLLWPLALGTSLAQDRPALAQQATEVIDRHPNTSPEVLRTYDVVDLLERAESSASPGTDRQPDEEASKAARTNAIAFLTDFITKNVRPAFEGTGQWVRITPNGTLVLHALIPQQEWVASLLERNRSREQMVIGQTTWIEGPKGAFQRMGIAAGASATVLEAKDRERFLELESDASFNVVGSPRLVVYPLSIGTVVVGGQLAYVKDYKLETVQPGDVKLPVPEIERVFEGFELQARTVLLDAQELVLDITAANTAVRQPIPTKTVTLAPEITQELRVAMPEIDRKSIQARCTLSPDGVLAFCSPVAGHDDREFLILVSARAVTAAGLKPTPGEVTITASKKTAEEPKQPR